MTVSRGNLIAGKWVPGSGPEFHSTDPSTGEAAWTGREALPAEVEAAVAAARAAFPAWADLPLERRAEFLKAFAGNLRQNLEPLLAAISRETGKPHWEARQEEIGRAHV